MASAEAAQRCSRSAPRHKLIHVSDRELAERFPLEDALPKLPEEAIFAEDAAIEILPLVATLTERPCKSFRGAIYHTQKLGAESCFLQTCRNFGAAADCERHYSPAKAKRVVQLVNDFLVEQKKTLLTEDTFEQKDALEKKTIQQQSRKQKTAEQKSTIEQKSVGQNIVDPKRTVAQSTVEHSVDGNVASTHSWTRIVKGKVKLHRQRGSIAGMLQDTSDNYKERQRRPLGGI
mmetsp:Transcript_44420/g.96559  ORF Transcript_44420/g.96559 Transcript_44420/m.96559 type:complete len:233 (-) Transcript_44420:48-746(-)